MAWLAENVPYFETVKNLTFIQIVVYIKHLGGQVQHVIRLSREVQCSGGLHTDVLC